MTEYHRGKNFGFDQKEFLNTRAKQVLAIAESLKINKPAHITLVKDMSFAGEPAVQINFTNGTVYKIVAPKLEKGGENAIEVIEYDHNLEAKGIVLKITKLDFFDENKRENFEDELTKFWQRRPNFTK